MALPGVNPTYQYLDGAQSDGTVLGGSSAIPIYIGFASGNAVSVGVSSASTIKIGHSSAVPVGFWGATPSVQVAFTAAAVATTAPVSSGTLYGFSSAQANGLISLLNEIRAAMVSMGLKA